VNSESIIAVQAMSLVLSMFSIACMTYAWRRHNVDWRVVILPILLMINVSSFLVERLVVKLAHIVIPVLPNSLNMWATFIIFQLSLTAATISALFIINHKVNGKGGPEDLA